MTRRSYFLVPDYSHFLPHRVAWGIKMVVFKSSGDKEGIIKRLEENLTLAAASLVGADREEQGGPRKLLPS